jgi:hypothetical protein
MCAQLTHMHVQVYFPYLLINKKRYAGLYWTTSEKYDKMDCKGIVTVRRDNCPLVVTLINTCLHKVWMCVCVCACGCVCVCVCEGGRASVWEDVFAFQAHTHTHSHTHTHTHSSAPH